MVDNYIVNENTLFIMNKEGKTYVGELEKDLFVKEDMKKILTNSCLYYGCSLNGRVMAVKSMINISSKIPVLVSEIKNILMFPVSSSTNNLKVYISYNMIENYYQISKSKVLVEFKGNYKETFRVSYYTFHQQILRCSRLLGVYRERNYR